MRSMPPDDGWEARRRRILDTVRDIPAGSVASYGQIAEFAGIPRGARQVGRALRGIGDENVPWHRVVRASGHLAFAPGSQPWRRQRRRLEAEGIVMQDLRIDMRAFRWQPDLDELLWKPSASWD